MNKKFLIIILFGVLIVVNVVTSIASGSMGGGLTNSYQELAKLSKENKLVESNLLKYSSLSELTNSDLAKLMKNPTNIIYIKSVSTLAWIGE